MSDSESARVLAALGRALDRLRRLLLGEGITTSTPREALQEAFRAGWLADEAAWLQMLRDRNETSHTYNETVARRIYSNVRSAFPEMERTYRLLQARSHA